MEAETHPNPPTLAAVVPSPNTFPEEEPSGLLKEGAEPKPAGPPNAGDPPKVGGLPKAAALPKPAAEHQSRSTHISINSDRRTGNTPPLFRKESLTERSEITAS